MRGLGPLPEEEHGVSYPHKLVWYPKDDRAAQRAWLAEHGGDKRFLKRMLRWEEYVIRSRS